MSDLPIITIAFLFTDTPMSMPPSLAHHGRSVPRSYLP
jgi:hypothetical protein